MCIPSWTSVSGRPRFRLNSGWECFFPSLASGVITYVGDFLNMGRCVALMRTLLLRNICGLSWVVGYCVVLMRIGWLLRVGLAPVKNAHCNFSSFGEIMKAKFRVASKCSSYLRRRIITGKNAYCNFSRVASGCSSYLRRRVSPGYGSTSIS